MLHPLDMFHTRKQEPSCTDKEADFTEIYETPQRDGSTAQWDSNNVNERSPTSEPTTPVSQENCEKKKSTAKSAIRKFFGVKKNDHPQDETPVFPPDVCKEWTVYIE